MFRSVYSLLIMLVLSIVPMTAKSGSMPSFSCDGDSVYDFTECQGSYMPYPATKDVVAVPDSMQLVMINHVGRHGARYPSSDANCIKLKKALDMADSLGTITTVGRQLARVNDMVMALSVGQWGALDSLGMAEQRGLARRMYELCPRLFSSGVVRAMSSYSPRVMMSMMCFLHELDRLNHKPDYITSTGTVNSPLLRPFDTDTAYIHFRKGAAVNDAYRDFLEANCPTTAIERVLGDGFKYSSDLQRKELAMAEYYVVAGLPAMGRDDVAADFFTLPEYNALWACFNFRQYIQRTATVLSSVPADIASDLLMDIVTSTQSFVDGRNACAVMLRFGHAETIMPLASLLRLPGCNYETDDFGSVANHWRNFDIVPMAANIRFLLMKSRTDGRYWLRVDYNEHPVTLIPGDGRTIVPWTEARAYMVSVMP